MRIWIVFLMMLLLCGGCANKAQNLKKTSTSRGSEIVFKQQDLPLIDKNSKTYKKLCHKGDGYACYIAASSHLIGKNSPKDYKLALELNLKGCKLKNGLACNNVGGQNELGFGVDKNQEIALEFYKLACDLGQKTGCLNAIMLYELTKI